MDFHKASSEFEDRLQDLKRVSLDKGLRLTHQRMEVLRELVRAKDHPSAEALYRRVRERVPAISLDTVYRTLGTFERLGLIIRVFVPDGEGRFDADLCPHHHFFCRSCRSVLDFTWEEFDNQGLPNNNPGWGLVEDKQAVLRGICQNCRDKGQN